MKPVVDRLAKEYEGTVDFNLNNVEESQAAVDLANSLGITGVPTFILVNSDGVQAGRIVGGISEESLREKLDALK